MRPGGLYGSRVSALGVALAAGGVLLLVFMLRELFGPETGELARTRGEARRLVLWLPGSADPTALATRRRVAAWRGLLPDDPPLLQGEPDLARLEPGQRLIVIPDGRRLGDGELARLQRFLRDGGAVVLTGSFGVRDANESWRGYAVMESLLDVEAVVDLTREQSDGLVAARPGPLAAPLPRGGPVALVPEAGVPATADAAAEIAWSAVAHGPEPRGASRRRRIGSGRLAWIAAGPESSGSDAYAALARGAVRWAAGEPVAELLPESALAGADAVAPEALRALHDQVSVALVRVSERRLRLDVTNRGRGPVRGAAVRVHLGEQRGAARVAATRLPQSLPTLRRRAGGEQLDLYLPELGTGSQAWHIDWEGGADPRGGAS
jgi:hypothetical protein